jgi:hypothetical protein
VCHPTGAEPCAGSEANRPPRRERVARWVLLGLAVWAALAYAAVAVIALPHEADPDKRAVILMGGTLLAVWCVLGGLVQWRLREPLTRWLRRIPLWWPLRFVLLCTALALLEEAVTTGLTNLAPVFGGVTGAARITASANYLEVVCLHSVIMFVPLFVGWAVMLRLVAFSPAEVMLLFGLTGWLAELVTFGPHNVGMIGMWVYVYGLMVWLPARTVPAGRRARPARLWMWPLAVVAPFLFAVPWVPVVLLVRWAMGYTEPAV